MRLDMRHEDQGACYLVGHYSNPPALVACPVTFTNAAFSTTDPSSGESVTRISNLEA